MTKIVYTLSCRWA